MRIGLAAVLVCALFAYGCAPKVKIVKSNFESYAFKPSVTSETIPLAEAAENCKSFFPDFQSSTDDGDKNFSVNGSVNVLLETPEGGVICSVDSKTGRIDRVHDGLKAYSAHEYARVEANKRAQREAVRQKMLAIEEEARGITSGNSSAFIKKAKRAISDGFKDPDSARFRDLYLSNKAIPTLCGQVNAKNSYGGYVGYKSFYYNGLAAHIEGEGGGANALMYASTKSRYCDDKFADVE